MTNSRLLANDDPCPCRSGKTFAECCLREGRAAYVNGIPTIQKEEPPPEVTERWKQDDLRRVRFGETRPAIHADWLDQKWVAVGNKLLYSAKWKTPADFLSDYLKCVMTPAWGKAELAKPLAERHPVMQWYDATCRLQKKAKAVADNDEVFAVTPSGAMRAYMLLAFDLYALQHHSALQDRLVHRLRHIDQYQGARHELFAAATCIRAGFDIEYEDESDRSSKHTEFAAIHRTTGVRISVEAKSKHRKGVLGRPGDREPDNLIRTRLGGLINDALRKPHPHPLVIFLDLNLPHASPLPATLEWFKRFAGPLLRDIDRKGEDDPWSLLVFSNQPDHYACDDGPAFGGYAVTMFGKNGQNGLQPPSELFEVAEAATKFGTLPNRFEEM